MKNNTNNKLISFIIILLFFITIICAVNATDNVDDTTIYTYSEDSTHQLSQPDITTANKDKKSSDSKINTNQKQTKQAIDVNNYEELYNKIEDIKANSTNNEETINLNPGNYDITKTINWMNTKTTKTLTINGNKQTLDGQGQYQFIIIQQMDQ